MARGQTFQLGQFFGAFDRRHEVDGFVLADIRPDVADRDVPRHTHEHGHFVFVTGGAYVTSAHRAPDICVGPALVYNPPGTTHRDRFRSRTGRFFTVSIAPDAAAAADYEAKLLDRPTYLSSPVASRAVQQLVTTCARWDATATLPAEGLCWELLASMHGESQAPRIAPAWLWTACDLLRDRAHEAVSLGQVADAVGVHAIHVARVFRKFLRCTPGDYLRRARLERSAALLRDSRLALVDIAAAAGFADQSHLTRAFTRAFGIPPARYRRAMRGPDPNLIQPDST